MTVPYALLFPGQGSQFVGMGGDVAAVLPELLGCDPDPIVGFPLARLCVEGPEAELSRTDRVQPALLAVSLAYHRLLRDRLGAALPVGAAGHSLGEYAAAVAAGALSVAEALRLVTERGAAMWAASQMEPSGMAALIGIDTPVAGELCEKRRADGGRLWVANDNNPGQAVVAGGAADLAWLADNAASLGVRRVIPLRVSGAFHTPFMEPAAARLEAALDMATFTAPAFPVASNESGTLARSAAKLDTALRRQLTAPVQWQDDVLALARAGAEVFVHVGPGDVTAQMVKRIDKAARVLVANSVDSVAEAAGSLILRAD